MGLSRRLTFAGCSPNETLRANSTVVPWYTAEMPTTAYLSRRAVLPEGTHPAAIVADTITGRILRIAERDAPGPTDQTIDCGDHAILPGLIDPHVHINAPGRTDWEGWPTATRAAAAGGITTLVDMPLNSLPPTTTVEALHLKREAASAQSHVDYRLWAGAEGDPEHRGNQAHLHPLAHAGAPGYKCFLVDPGCEGLALLDEPNLRAALPLIAASGLPLLVHAELPAPLAAAAATLTDADWTRYPTYLASRPDESELAAIRLLIDLCREFGAKIHIVHLATAQALPLLRAARAEGLPLTVETCPHYLHFAAEDIPQASTLHKCAPPIRSAANRELLWAAVADRTIDLIASDHSPCSPEMKLGNPPGSFRTSWGGIASLGLTLPILWTGLQPRGGTLADLARLMSSAPAALAGLAHRKGSLVPGFDADLLILAPEESFTVTPAHLHFLHPITPYLGQRLTGVVKQTILRGHTIYQDGAFPSPPIGREVIP